MPDIESLDIKVKVTADQAVKSLDDLKTKLSELDTQAKKTKSTSKKSAKGVKDTAAEIGKFASSLNTAGFSNAAKEVKKIQSVAAQAKGMKEFSKQAETLAKSLEKLGETDAAKKIREMADPFKQESNLRQAAATAKANSVAEKAAKQAEVQKAKEQAAAAKAAAKAAADAERQKQKEIAAAQKAAAAAEKQRQKELVAAQRAAEKQALAEKKAALKAEADALKEKQRKEREALKEAERLRREEAAAAKKAAQEKAKADREAEKAAKELEKAEAKKRAEEQKRLAAALNTVSTSFKGMLSPLTNAIKGVQNFIKAIGRIALYRAIRTAIKNISAAVKEGLTNLKAYSAEVGTEFAPAVENLQKHVLLLKNSFATALRPVIEAILPTIIQLVDWFSKLADFAAQVFSILTGKVDSNGRYTKAVLSDLEQSNKQAKELRRTLLGFDEINRLDGDTGSGQQQSTGLMFTQADVSPEAVTMAEKLQTIFGKVKEFIKSIDWSTVLKILGIIGGLIAGAKIATGISKVVVFFKSLWTIVQKIWPIIKSIVGGISPVAGIVIAIVAAFALWGDKISEFFEKIRTKGNSVFDWIDEKVKFSSALSAINDVQRSIWNMVTGTIGKLASAIYKLFHGDFKGALKDLVSLIATVIKGIIGIVVGLANIVLGIVDDIIYYVKVAAQFIWNKAIVPVVNGIATAFAKVKVAVHNAVVDFKIGMQQVFKWIIEKVNSLVLEPLTKTINSAIAVWNKVMKDDVEPIDLTVDTTHFDDKIEELKETKLPPITETVQVAAEWTNEIEKLGLKIDTTGVYDAIDNVERKLNNAIDRIGKKATSIYDATGALKPGANGGLVQAYASGGFPTAGSYFLAGENGPEYVGSINGQTGVWNSDQMAQALYNAVASAMAQYGGGGGDIYLDGEVIYKNTVRRNNNQVRSTGRSALLT